MHDRETVELALLALRGVCYIGAGRRNWGYRAVWARPVVHFDRGCHCRKAV